MHSNFQMDIHCKSTMDWSSVYLAPQDLPKYIYLSPPLIFPTTYNGIRTKNCPVWISPGAAPILYVEWDRFVTLAGSKSGLRVTLSYLLVPYQLVPLYHINSFSMYYDQLVPFLCITTNSYLNYSTCQCVIFILYTL